tara:strand:- start:28500 stop:28865 length:366 start_codon:yes stop_codon:yes gene_type:complete
MTVAAEPFSDGTARASDYNSRLHLHCHFPKEHIMLKKTLLLGAVLLAPSLALADADCTAHPKAEWKSEAEARAHWEAQGYTISKFKVSGDCYEIYGYTADKKKAEIYFDTKTLEVVKSEIE